MSFRIYDSNPGPGFWKLETGHFPAGMSRHLWELLMPPYDAAVRLGFARYGSVIDHIYMARIKGRVYTRLAFVEHADELCRRRATAENALAKRLWREDREAWPGIREEFRSRLLSLSREDPWKMDSARLLKHLVQCCRLSVLSLRIVEERFPIPRLSRANLEFLRSWEPIREQP